MTLEEAKKAIKEPDQQAMELCKRRWDSIAKPHTWSRGLFSPDEYRRFL